MAVTASTTPSRLSADFKGLEKGEPLLKENPRRWVLFPVQYPGIYEMYKERQASVWIAEEIWMAQDAHDWRSLAEGEQRFIKLALAFFVASGAMLAQNLGSNFSCEIQVPEARAFYGFQTAMLNIHAQTISMMMARCIPDPAEMARVFDVIPTVPAAQAKANWVAQWMNQDHCFAERLVAFACVEGILPSGSFCAIHRLRMRGKMPGLTCSNERMLKDEGLHVEFACVIYGMLQNKLPEDAVHKIVMEAVDVERRFICEALPCDLIGTNSKPMEQYIESVADRLLTALGYSKLFGAANPFDWMMPVSFQSLRVHASPTALTATSGSGAFCLDADF